MGEGEAMEDETHWTPSRILFVAGLPRSGTTLLEVFLGVHGDNAVVPLANTRAATNEYRPEGSLIYGGSHHCLRDMCGANGYVTKAHRDHARHDCAAYVDRARAVRLSHPELHNATLALSKDPGLTLSIAELSSSCEQIGVRAVFVVVVRSPFQWEASGSHDDYPCSGTCRENIIDGWSRCMAKVDAVVRATSPASTHRATPHHPLPLHRACYLAHAPRHLHETCTVTSRVTSACHIRVCIAARLAQRDAGALRGLR